MKKLLTLTALGTIMVCSNANASGFNLKEQSATAMGNAFAGATAGAEDSTYAYFNPAAMSRLKGDKMSMGGTLIAPRSKARGASSSTPGINGNDFTPRTENIVHAAVSPNFAYTHQVNDDWTVGITANTPYGMITMYDNDWAGRFHGVKSDVKTLNIMPMASYKATDKLALGAGLQFQYIKAKLTNGAALPTGNPGRPVMEDYSKLKGDTLDLGYTIGALYEFTPMTRVGAAYHSEVKHKLKGDIKFNNVMSMNQDISARLTTPASVNFGVYHDVTEKWAVMAEYQRTMWHSFKYLDIIGEKNGKLSSTFENWRDTDFYSIGTSYQLNDQWKIRGGLAYENGAVQDGYRTPRIPDASRVWYSCGAEYKFNEQLTFNAAYTYIRANKSSVELNGNVAGGYGTIHARYENDIHMAALGLNYSF